MWKYTASPVNIDIQIWKVFRWKKWINASDNKMGYGSEGSLVLKHHDHKRHFSNKDLEVPHISYNTVVHPWQYLPRNCLRRLQREGSIPSPVSQLSPDMWRPALLQPPRPNPGGSKFSRLIEMSLTSSNSWTRLTQDIWQSWCTLQLCHFIILIWFAGDKVVITSPVPIFWYIQCKMREELKDLSLVNTPTDILVWFFEHFVLFSLYLSGKILVTWYRIHQKRQNQPRRVGGRPEVVHNVVLMSPWSG